MARTLLSWRWAAATVLLLAAVLTMLLLGRWQWERSVPVPEATAVDLGRVETSELPAVTAVAGSPGAGALVPPGTSGEVVRVQGTWRGDRVLLVADRELGTRPGRWVVQAVELGDGGLVPVVRGWSAAGAAPPAPLEGRADVVGWVQQSEPLDIPVEVLQPDGVVALLSTADLANRWPEELVPGFVVVAPTPAQAASPGLALLPDPPEQETETRDWRNLAYSAQWVVFAGFAVLLWWRMLRDSSARRTVPPAPVERSTA